MFPRNIGGLDRVLRLTFGAALFVAGVFLLMGKSSLGVIVIVVGSLALLTGIIRCCVLYIPFGISTARPREKGMSPVCDCETWIKQMQPVDSTQPRSSDRDSAKHMPAAPVR